MRNFGRESKFHRIVHFETASLQEYWVRKFRYYARKIREIPATENVNPMPILDDEELIIRENLASDNQSLRNLAFDSYPHPGLYLLIYYVRTHSLWLRFGIAAKWIEARHIR